MGKCTIKAEVVAKALEISKERLAEICDFFDQDPNDDWELIEGEHYEWGVNKTRMFSPEGSLEICNYLLEHGQKERSLFTRVKRWVLQQDKQHKELMVGLRVHEAGETKGSIVYQNGRAFLAPKACRDILGLGTRQDILKRTFSELQRSENTEIESLRINHDFLEQESAIYLSGSGLASVGKQLSVRLTQRHRQAWVKAVEEAAPKTLALIEKEENSKKERREAAERKARERCKNRCEITNKRQDVEGFNLAVHHLYCKSVYPNLADEAYNLLVLDEQIHKHFHKWMGGSKVPCTPEDMERYVAEFATTLFNDDDQDKNFEQLMKVKRHLSKVKKMLAPLAKQDVA